MKKFVILMAAVALVSSSALAAPKKSNINPNKYSAAQKADGGSESDYGNASSKKSAAEGTMIRPLFGWNLMNPKALNNHIMESTDNTAFKIGNGTSFGLAAEYPVIKKTFYLGARIEYFSSGSSTSTLSATKDANGNKLDKAVEVATGTTKMSGLPIMATASYNNEFAPNWGVGATLGAGIIAAHRYSTEITSTKFENSVPVGTLTYSSTPFVGMAAAHLQHDFSKRFGARFETGYRLSSSSEMTANEKYGDTKAGDLLKDKNGKNLTVDSSAFMLGLQMVVTL